MHSGLHRYTPAVAVRIGTARKLNGKLLKTAKYKLRI